MTSPKTVEYVVDQMAGAGPVSFRKMFGEYGLYLDGKMFALVCDDQLFIRPTDAGRALLGSVSEGSPYPGAKPHFLIPGDQFDNRELLGQLARITADALPLAAKKNAAKKNAAKKTTANDAAAKKAAPSRRAL
jgi:DNA transformation protein and related proteins